jgi:hypothetical protein
VKRIAANKVEGYYRLANGQPGIDRVKHLIMASMYIYPTKGIRVPHHGLNYVVNSILIALLT